jgi:O-antigen/teichoic acid export membrane protein
LPGINAFRVLVWGAYFFSLINILSAYLVAQDRQILFSKIYLVTIFFITILVFLMSKFELGIVGVAIATSLSYLIAFGAIFYLSLPQWTLQVRVNQVALIIFLSPVVGISNIICIELISGWTHISFDPFNLLKLVFYLSASIAEILYINSYFGLIDKYIQRLKMVRFLGIN